ncbi:hypothetical protein [Chitinophaga qingshengii]|uniref:Secretin/TonB short N-terminal domain-containing protein n=1 Tax=Chitinophaga qingshengii TaxID=1569794 RepID=A0ABR7TP30_9BACT|nr:hypothetical protein [Chitinophaga qingshengii]MBC9932224.1 hypothetical protein [Chitinophaga qingshengii]
MIKLSFFLFFWLYQLTISPHHWSDQAEKIKINVNVRNAPLREVLKLISQQTGLRFFGTNTTPYDTKVSLQQNGMELYRLLDELLIPLQFSWEISGKVIIISKKNAPAGNSPAATDILSLHAPSSP